VGRGQDDEHRLALEHRLPFDDSVLLDLLREPLQQMPPQLGMAQLAAPETDRHLDSIAVLEELDRAMDLRLEVTHADLRREADFLEADALSTLGLLLPLRELVLVLPEVEKTSDRWSRHRCHLDEVEALLLCHLEGSWRGHDAQLVSLIVDHSDLWDPDHLVDAQVSADGCFPLERRSWSARLDRGKARAPPAAAG
jgi:hypothetical protein